MLLRCIGQPYAVEPKCGLRSTAPSARSPARKAVAEVQCALRSEASMCVHRSCSGCSGCRQSLLFDLRHWLWGLLTCAAVAEMDTSADFARDSLQYSRAMCLLQCVRACASAQKFCCNATVGWRSRATVFGGSSNFICGRMPAQRRQEMILRICPRR